ncbi:MAG: cyclopropane fatty acyl phospholipid synthase [Acidobacteriia bacterium]|nr:cyclopropane fatty acyl phospholipid synthase [Terriglobia bacterium]
MTSALGSGSGGNSLSHPSFEVLPDRRPTAPESPALRSRAARKIAQLLALADIRINGGRPWDIRVHNDRFYRRVFREGSIAAGESYMDGWWDVDTLDEFFAGIHRAGLYDKVGAWSAFWLSLQDRIVNRQAKSRAQKVAQDHYDRGNDLYEAMLDRRMQYTCAYWNGARTLDEAQENKLSLIARKLKLSPGMDILELGGGFGGLAYFLATEYGCHVVSYNISREQVAYARALCQGLPVRFEQKDYREAAGERGPFDRVVAIGLCEHIGHKNYRRFLELAHAQLKSRGLFLLHTIGGNRSLTSTDPWFDKYIFPNGMIPSIAQLAQAMESLWVVEDWHNFGPDYDKTLLAWWENFDRAWPQLRARYGDRFYRMWRFYLMGSAGGFRARKLQLWQIVLSKGDVPSYTPVR